VARRRVAGADSRSVFVSRRMLPRQWQFVLSARQGCQAWLQMRIEIARKALHRAHVRGIRCPREGEGDDG